MSLSPVGSRASADPPAPADGPGSARRGFFRPGWPVTALLVGYPVLWVLGVSAFAVQLAALPMAIHLFRQQRVRVPIGFGIWLLFLLCSAMGLLVLGVDPTGTVRDTFHGRLIGYADRESSYLAVTIVLLYLGNLTEKEFPTARLLRSFDVFFVYVTVGGVLGLLWPQGSFPSLLELALPESLTSVPYVSHLVHPSFAQVQEFGDSALPRPSAPFPYTNSWGSSLAMLGIWFVLRTAQISSRPIQVVRALLVCVALVTIVYSLNRGVWLGIGLCVLYVVGALLRRGNLVGLTALLAALGVAGVVFVNAPLQQVFETRIEHGNSDTIRAFTTERALDLAAASPLIGFGSTRSAIGSPASIAVGKSPDCRTCGNVPIGINGYLFGLLVTTGIGGTALFFGFWLSQLWHSRGDRGAEASAARLSLVLAMFFAFFYGIEYLFPFVAIAILWRRRQNQDSADAIPQ